MVDLIEARAVRVYGTVVGVGYRAFVVRLAEFHGLNGWVRNEGPHVHLHAEGDASALEIFLMELGSEAPESATVGSIEVQSAPVKGALSFVIESSK